MESGKEREVLTNDNPITGEYKSGNGRQKTGNRG
jgi:hypothetical protein